MTMDHAVGAAFAWIGILVLLFITALAEATWSDFRGREFLPPFDTIAGKIGGLLFVAGIIGAALGFIIYGIRSFL